MSEAEAGWFFNNCLIIQIIIKSGRGVRVPLPFLFL